jgi:hypothetical protein
MNKTIGTAEQTMLASDSKIGLLVTVDEDGYPHISFISSIQALGEDRITFGKFCAGLSKKHLETRPHAAFLALNADMEFLRGNATFTHTAITGDEHEAYNAKPMFRYNSYFGFDTIYYLALSGITPMEKLSMGKIAMGAILTRAVSWLYAKNSKQSLTRIGKGLFAKIDGLKFIAYFDADERLRIVPIIQAGPAGTDRVAFSPMPFGKELKAVPAGCKAAIFAVNLKMESVLVKGIYRGRQGISRTGVLDIERVYNSMPPKNEYIYPRDEVMQPVTEF